MSLHPTGIRKKLPPGVGLVVFEVVPNVLKPVIAVLVGYQVLQLSGTRTPQPLLDFVRSHPVLATALASSGLSFVTGAIRGVHRATSDWLERRALGAVYPPWINHRLPLGIDILSRILEKWDSGYLGEGFAFLLDENNATTIGFTTLGENRILTKDPWFIKSTLVTDFGSFEKGELTVSAMRSVIGTGIFSADGELWKFHRTMARPFFSLQQLGELSTTDKHAKTVVSQVLEMHQTGKPFDLQELAQRFTLDVATEFFLGTCVDSLQSPLPVQGYMRGESEATQFADAFASAQWQMSWRFRAGKYWPYSEMFNDATKDNTDIIDAFVQPILNNALEKKRAGRRVKLPAGQTGQHITMLDHLVGETDDVTLIRDQLMSILLAGRDTTAATITYMIYTLAMSPDVLAKLRQEVLDVVGEDGEPTLETIREMKYMRAVTLEILRLYPPVPFNPRVASRNTTVTNPEIGQKFFIPKGTTIFHGFCLMHVRKDLWGDDADIFDPERWIDERKERVLKNPFMFLPFQAGPRVCLGQQFALNQIAFFMSRLLQSIERIELCPEAFPESSLAPKEWKNGTDRRRFEVIHPRASLMMYAPGGMWVKMYPPGSPKTTQTVFNIAGKDHWS